MIKITSLTILSASLFRLSPSFSRRLYHAENLWLGSLRNPPRPQKADSETFRRFG